MPPSARVCAARRRSLGLPRDRRARSGSPAVLGRMPCRPDDFASPAFAGFAFFRILVCVRYRIASSIADCGEVYRRRRGLSHRRQRLIRSEVHALACQRERGGRECPLTCPVECSCLVADAIKAANRARACRILGCVDRATVGREADARYEADLPDESQTPLHDDGIRSGKECATDRGDARLIYRVWYGPDDRMEDAPRPASRRSETRLDSASCSPMTRSVEKFYSSTWAMWWRSSNYLNSLR